MAEMNREQKLAYKKRKQKEYRDKARGKPPHHRPTFVAYTITTAVLNIHVPTEEILKSAGHCGYCGCLLSHEWHDQHPLVGCERYIREYGESYPQVDKEGKMDV